MITDAEIRRRASVLGVQQDHVERDYVLNHLLAHVGQDPGSLIFRGDTALARVYWPDFRLSEDLDFITPGVGDDIARAEQEMVDRAVGTTGIDLRLEVGKLREDRSRSVVSWATPWDSQGQLLIDVVRRESPALPAETRALDLPYSDLAGEYKLLVHQLADILGSKWGMLDDRDEPRDLFDIWFALTQWGVPFEEIVRGHRARYRYDPQPSVLERAGRLATLWRDRLGHQMRELPEFRTVLGEVKSVYGQHSESVKG